MPFPRVLTGLVAAGVVLAAVVLWRVARPRALRWMTAALGIYGTIGLVHAALTATSLRAALGGDGLVSWLPRVLQGAVLGAFLVLPLGWIVAMAQAGISRFRQGSRRSAICQAVALTLCLALVLVSFPRFSARASHASRAERIAVPDTAARAAQLDRSLRAIEDGERESPRDRWDPDYVVAMVGRDPQRLFEWVRDNTYWIPYRGMLRGPVGVLMDRQGNSLDRALLLATLLEKAGKTVRLAHAELSDVDVTGLLPDVVSRRAFAFRPLPATRGTSPDLSGVAGTYQLDGVGLERQLGDLEDEGSKMLAAIDQRVAEQAARLSAAITPAGGRDWSLNLESARRALADHWWVQQQDAATWVDWDPIETAGDGHLHLADPTETLGAHDLPSELAQQLVIRVVCERWADGVSRESKVLEQVVRPVDMVGQPAVLQFWPGSWPSEIASDPDGAHGMKAAALEQTEWAAVLQVGGQPTAQAVIGEAGAASAASTNPFGGLAGSFSATVQQGGPARSATSALTAAWIEYEVRIPGDPPRATRRVVFDLLGPAKRAAHEGPSLPLSDAQRLARSLSLMMRTEILPVTCGLSPAFLAHLTNQSFSRNAPLLRSIALGSLAPEEDATRKLLADARPPVSPLDTLAMLRARWGRSAHRAFISEINVLTRHDVPVAEERGIVLQEATDIVENRVGVDLVEPHPFQVRLERGVFDTNAEALLGAGPAATNTANAFGNSIAWITLTPGERSAVDRTGLPEDVKRQIAADLERGLVVVAPDGSRSAGFAGWWRIDPTTGQALGMDSRGWGSSLTERGVLTSLAARFAAAFNFEYGLCMAFPQAVNALVALQSAITFKLFEKQHVQAYNAVDLASKTNRTCLISAIAQGFIATLPLLLMTLRAEQRLVRATPGTGAPDSPPAQNGGPKPNAPPPEPDLPPCNGASGEGEAAGTSAAEGPQTGSAGEPSGPASRVSEPPAEPPPVEPPGGATPASDPGVVIGPSYEPISPQQMRQRIEYTSAEKAKAEVRFREAQATYVQKLRQLQAERPGIQTDKAIKRAEWEFRQIENSLSQASARDSFARQVEAANDAAYAAQQRYLETRKRLWEWRKAHPSECGGDYLQLSKEAAEAAAEWERAREEFWRARQTKPPVGSGSTSQSGNGNPTRPVGNENPTMDLQPPNASGEPGSAQPSLDGPIQLRPPGDNGAHPIDTTGDTQPSLPQAGGGQAGASSESASQGKTSSPKTIAGQLGVADALKKTTQ